MDNLIKELDLQAQKHISGGFWDWVVGTFLGGMLYDLTFHTGETIESFNAGRDAANAMWNTLIPQHYYKIFFLST